MNPIIAAQITQLRANGLDPDVEVLPSGAHLITIRNVPIPAGWNRQSTNVLFLAPPSYPGGMPDCFWVEPTQMRLADGGTPQGSSDGNPIPEVPGRQVTWFSWHIQDWNPNKSTLLTYFNVIKQRFRALQ